MGMGLGQAIFPYGMEKQVPDGTWAFFNWGTSRSA